MFPPNESISIPGGNATFYCVPFSPAVSVQWYINDAPSANLSTAIITEFSAAGDGIGVLLLTNISQHYNNTRIQCRARLHTGETLESDTTILLLLTGFVLHMQLAIVEALQNLQNFEQSGSQKKEAILQAKCQFCQKSVSLIGTGSSQ